METTKTICIEFNNNKENNNAESFIKVGKDKLKIMSEAKFLGIWLDKKLDFKKQLEVIRNKGNKACNLLSFTCGIYYGMEINTALMLYKSYIRSVLEYGLFLFLPTKFTELLKIERVQYAGIRKALGYRVSTPTNVLIAESKVVNMRDRAIFLARNLLLKNVMYDNIITKENLKELEVVENNAIRQRKIKFNSYIIKAWNLIQDKIIHKVKNKKKFEIFDTNYWTATNEIECEFDIGKDRLSKVIDDNKMKELIIEKYDLQKESEFIFTDGSKTKSGISVGAGIYVENSQLAFGISMHAVCSVTTAELVAIQAALWIALNKVHNKDIVILSDSEVALKAITNNNFAAMKNVYALKARQFIENIKSQRNNTRKIILAWTPSHIAVEGNEIVDMLAKECTNEDQNEEVKIPRADWKTVFKKEAWENTQKDIIQESNYKGKIYFDKFYDNKKTPWFIKMNNDKNIIAFINRLRANHYNLNESLARKNIVNLPDCQCGHKKEDINYVIFECPLLEEEREKFLLDLQKINASKPYCMWNWLQKKELKVIKRIFKFLMQMDRVI